MISIRRIRPIIKKEFRQIRRDKRSLGVLLVIPAFMLIMFGYALNYDVRHIPLAVFDQDQSTRSREFISEFLHSEYFDNVATVTQERQIDTVLSHRIAGAILVIPSDFSKQLLANRMTKVQLIVDGANAMSATTAIGYLTGIMQHYSNKIAFEALARNGIARPALPIDFRPRIWYNPELKSAKFLVPGLIGFILMISTVISTSLSIVREREKGTMEQITVSPIHPMELLLGKTVPYVLISLVSTTLILTTGYFLFDVAVRGSYLLLFIVTLLFILCGLGVGLFVSTVADTQEEAFMLSSTLSMLPTFMLSGFTFPIVNMPKVIQLITYANPARYFLSSLRDIIIKGVGIQVIWQECLFMTLFAIWIIGVSWNKMRKRTL